VGRLGEAFIFRRIYYHGGEGIWRKPPLKARKGNINLIK